MSAILNEDILNLIYSHTFDFEDLRATATALSISKFHPLRDILLHRVLQLPLRLSSEDLEDSTALIDHFVRNAAQADLIREVYIALGLSRKSLAESARFEGAALPEDVKQAERAEALVESLPELLKRTGNLQRLDWSKSPPPSKETLEALFEHSRVTQVSLDCSMGSIFLPDPSEPLDVPDAATDIRPLFSTIGPKVTSLDLRNVDEDAFKAIKQDLPALRNIRNLKLDLTCGVWDWDGRGSPQQGPTEHYKFDRISDGVEEFDLTITDLLARKPRGPVELVDPKSLTKLRLEVIPCFAWVGIDIVRIFSDFTAADFSSLTHLVIEDTIRHSGRWNIGGKPREGDWDEGGRTYLGIHELIPSLPQLRHLWVNERVLAIPPSDIAVDVWNARPFEKESQESILSRTVNSSHWELLGRAFEKLESLRVGFGPLNAHWVAKVLSHCDRKKLKAFGFDFEWQPGSTGPGVFSELITTLSEFVSLTDLHILHPNAMLPIPVHYGNSPEYQLAIRRLHESEETKGLVKELFSKLPDLYRVGVGRNSVWERQTRWREGDNDEFLIQRLHRARVPPFYDTGSSHPFVDVGKYDEHPAIKDVLKLLGEL